VPRDRPGPASYRRAEELFVVASGGRSLHDLRRAALTHLGEDNVSLPLLTPIIAAMKSALGAGMAESCCQFAAPADGGAQR
jgi:hypothetical protein